MALFTLALSSTTTTVHFAPRHGRHALGRPHPENPGRLDRIVVPAVEKERVEWRRVWAKRPDAERAVRRVHDEAYVDSVKEAASSLSSQKATTTTFLGPDTYVVRESFEALLEAQSTWLDAVDDAATRRSSSWALSRPPGHHASAASADGFCVFNFAAAAGAYALEEKDVDWVAFLDWDVHHGNGIAAYVDTEPRATYASVHQSPLWPGTGDDATDVGPLGNRRAVPVRRGADGREYQEAWDACLDFALNSSTTSTLQRGRRGLLIVAAGFDALRDDPLAQCALEPRDFRRLSKSLRDRCAHHANVAGVVFGIEGGYSDAMGPAVAYALRPWTALLDDDDDDDDDVDLEEEADIVVCSSNSIPPRGTQRRVLVRELGGHVCVSVDANGVAHVASSRLPGTGLPTADFGVFDPEVGQITDPTTGTKFYVETGDVRGERCPKRKLPWFFFRGFGGGGTANAAAQKDEKLGTAPSRRLPDGSLVAKRSDLARLVVQEQETTRPLALAKKAFFFLAGVRSRARFEAIAATAPVVVSTTSSRKDSSEIRSAAVAEGGVELGYYLVRTPKASDAPTPGTDAVIADLLHAGDLAAVEKPSAASPCARVAAGVAVFVEPAARKRKLGVVLFKEAMLACRLLGFRYMLFVERDSGSGRLVRWYENMGFRKIPSGALPGLDRAMVGRLPDPDDDPAFYHADEDELLTVLKPFSSSYDSGWALLRRLRTTVASLLARSGRPPLDGGPRRDSPPRNIE